MTAELDPAALLKAMAPRGRIDQSMLSEAIKAIAGRSLEAHGVHLSELAVKLAAKKATDPQSARRLPGPSGGGELSVFAPPTGDPWFSAIVVRYGKELFVFSIGLSGKPDPKLDQFIEDLLGRAIPRRADRQPDPRNVRRVDVYRIPVAGNLAVLFSEISATKWRSDKLFGSSFSSCGENGRWLDGNTDLSAAGVDHWVEAFGALRIVLDLDGDQARIVNDAKIVGARTYRNFGDDTPDLAHYDAAVDYGIHFARLDDFVPSANCVSGIDALVAAQAGLDLHGTVDMLDRIHEACTRAGHVNEDGEFDFNDLGCFAHADQEGNVKRVSLRDQNRRHRAEFAASADGVTVSVFSAPADAPHGSEKPLVQIIVRPNRSDEQPMVTKGPGVVGDDIRAWNSFVSCVESADCCLEEDYGRSPSP